MLKNWIILLVSFGYIGLLFAIAYYGDRRADQKKSIISNHYIYSLSLAVYCTAWTFYGSVGLAANSGLNFLPIYLGPTLTMALWFLVMRKIIRICKQHHITSIADFITSRYGKNPLMGGVVTIIAVIGIIPYIALQLKAISTNFMVISQYPDIISSTELILSHGYKSNRVFQDTPFFIALLLAAFTIIFGTRHIDTTERHEGLVAAIAFESIVKLAAFLAVGIFVTYGIYDGFGDLFEKAKKIPDVTKLLRIDSYNDWFWSIFVSMMAIMFLPRQFQLTVVENVNEAHLKKAAWLFPLYMLIINIFVIPIALGGLLHFPGGNVDADTFVLTLPMAEHQEALALFVFIGGMSAATGMVIVETIALSTMMCNDLVIPVLLKTGFMKIAYRADLRNMLLLIRRCCIIALLLGGYLYYHTIGEYFPLVSIGMMSFTAVAQFAPSILGGIFWKRGTLQGAMSGLVAGFIIWVYTLTIPSLAQSGVISQSFIENGLFGISFLRPFHLFGMEGMNNISHALFWSMLINISLYAGVSIFSRQSETVSIQAELFVDVFKSPPEFRKSNLLKREASVPDLQTLLVRFLGADNAQRILAKYAGKRGINLEDPLPADTDMVAYVEKHLAGTIGSASARAIVSSVTTEEVMSLEQMMTILDETQQVLAYSRELEQKSLELQKASEDLKNANERLKELDRLKDDFISTITHELRTPLTSIRSFSEILHDSPKVDEKQRQKFLGIIIQESQRLTRLINQILDLHKLESKNLTLDFSKINIAAIIRESLEVLDQLIRKRNIKLIFDLQEKVNPVRGDHDYLMQVMLNLFANAIKYSKPEGGDLMIRLRERKMKIWIDVIDNGVGISGDDQHIIFEKFRQAKNMAGGRPQGSGLGLPITRRIIELHGGRIRVKSRPGAGSTFTFYLPVEKAKEIN